LNKIAPRHVTIGKMDKLFAVCSPGLEPYLVGELRQLGLPFQLAPDSDQTGHTAEGWGRDDAGGVSFAGDLLAVYRANLWLRTASRILVRLGEFRAVSFPELRKKAARLEWERYIKPGQALALRVTCKKSRLYHSDAVAERVAGAISDRLKIAPPIEKFDDKSESAPAQLVVVRLAHDQCTVSIDSSGALLHRRGYRLASAKAPLRETLAAGLLLASGWNCEAPVLDPFCGSGTIAIEAALIAKQWAPGRARRFAFMEWPDYQASAWSKLLADCEPAVNLAPSTIQASDRDAGAIRMAQENAARAGVDDLIEFSCRAVSAITPQGLGWIVTNPPYGERLSANKDLRNLYAQFGNVIRSKCPGWRLSVLSSDVYLLRQIGLKLDASLALVNGGIAVRLGIGQVPGANPAANPALEAG
jgi:putative N6-adenine-specific DNA methylase